jgi:NAD(P)H-dependent FMN reductase
MLPYPETYEGRGIAFTGLAAGQWGALRAVEQLQMVFGYRNAPSLARRVFIPEVFKQLDKEGKLIDEELQTRIEAQATEFVAFCGALFPV